MINGMFFYQGYLPILLSRTSILKKLRIFIMNKFIPIRYGGYWDVPNSFLTEYKSKLYLFTRYGFDDELDDYPPNYEVYSINDNISLKAAFESGFLDPDFYNQKTFIGEIPTADVIFDWTNRKFVNTTAFEMIKPLESPPK